MKTFLSIDVGTSSTKLTLFDEQGQHLTARSVSYPVEYPYPDWAEQDPRSWWQAVCQAGPEITQSAGAAGGRLAGISVSGQTPSCVPVDKTGRPLRKAILWLDRRATAQVDWLREHIGEERCREVSANRLDSYFGGLKWLWFRQEEPGIFAHTWKILQASSYIVYHLTGQAIVDPAQAGLCSPCFNTTTGDWDESILAVMDIPPALLPVIAPAFQVVGEVTAAGALASGLPEGVPVVCGGADFACAGLGAGVTGPGSAALMLGTAGNLLFPGMASRDPRLLHTVHLTGQPLPFGGVLAGTNLNWFAALLRRDDPAVYSQLDEEAQFVPPGSEGLVFLPYLMGERTPIWDPAARGAFIGLTGRHGRSHLYRAILEGVAFAFRQIAEIVSSRGAALPLQEIIAIDGGARSQLWRQILADVLALPIRQGSQRSGTALGSAFLAMLGTGAAPGFEIILPWAATSAINQPDPNTCRRYNEIYPVYAGLYTKLKPDFEQLGR